MPDRKTVMSWLEGLAQDDWRQYHSDSEVQEIAKTALALLWEQDNCENCAIAIEDRQLVVRCKDCKYWRQLLGLNGSCDCDDIWRSLEGEITEVEYIRTNEDFYCGYAESGR